MILHRLKGYLSLIFRIKRVYAKQKKQRFFLLKSRYESHIWITLFLIIVSFSVYVADGYVETWKEARDFISCHLPWCSSVVMPVFRVADRINCVQLYSWLFEDFSINHKACVWFRGGENWFWMSLVKTEFEVKWFISMFGCFYSENKFEVILGVKFSTHEQKLQILVNSR